MHGHLGTGEIERVTVVFHHEFEGAEHVPPFEAVIKGDNLLYFVTVELHVARAESLGYFIHGHLERFDNGGNKVVFGVIPNPDTIRDITEDMARLSQSDGVPPPRNTVVRRWGDKVKTRRSNSRMT